jgi:hypothetical protein
MAEPLFAKDGGDPSSFVSFCHRWGDVASVLGFVLGVASLIISLVGFGLTLRALFRVKQATREALGKVGMQLLVAETSALLRLVTEARDAARDGLWPRAIDRCQQARHIVVPLAHNPHLLEEEQAALRKADNDLRLVLQYIENERLPPTSQPGNLPDAKKRAMDAMVTALGNIQGRLQTKALEV